MLTASELIVDSFAGGGGASTGIFMATGRHPDFAINHDPEALALHASNHPEPGTRHFCEDVWALDPKELCGGRPVGLAWFSPNCQHHSKARGGKPVNKKIRALAWVVVRWARTVRPRVLCVENVQEFATWGRLDADNQPDPRYKGETFRKWVAQIRREGYQVEMRELRACDYGVPTTRSRLFLVARCDGKPIVWPEPTHGPGKLPYRSAASIIDWSVPTPSIFERKRPLSEKTMARIARGLRKFVLEAAEPFVIAIDNQSAGVGPVWSVNAPLTTITTKARHCVVAPVLVQTGYGERKGQAPRCLDLQMPLGTIVAGGGKHALVAAFLSKAYAGNVGPGSSMNGPLHTITTQDHNNLVGVALAKEGEADGPHRESVLAWALKFYGTATGSDLGEPLHTITTKARFGLVTVNRVDYRIVDIGMRMLTPRELYRAQGFPEDYQFEVAYEGEVLSQAAQTRMVGNSVCPPLAAAMVAAQLTGQVAAKVAA